MVNQYDTAASMMRLRLRLAVKRLNVMSFDYSEDTLSQRSDVLQVSRTSVHFCRVFVRHHVIKFLRFTYEANGKSIRLTISVGITTCF